jgi:hypothetical protein
MKGGERLPATWHWKALGCQINLNWEIFNGSYFHIQDWRRILRQSISIECGFPAIQQIEDDGRSRLATRKLRPLIFHCHSLEVILVNLTVQFPRIRQYNVV